MRDKSWRQEPGGRRNDTCDHGLSRSWKVEVWEKEKEKGQQDLHHLYDNKQASNQNNEMNKWKDIPN